MTIDLSEIPKAIREKMVLDEIIFGDAFCLKKEDGTYERIDPMKVKLNPETKKWELDESFINEKQKV